MGVFGFQTHKTGFFGGRMLFSGTWGSQTGLSHRWSDRLLDLGGSSRWQSLGESNPSLQVENLAS